MIDIPRGMLRATALRLVSESTLSGRELAEQISKLSSGLWNPSPGSIYPILSSLLNEGLITEIPRKEKNQRRYIITSKGKKKLEELQESAEQSIVRHLEVVAFFARILGRQDLSVKITSALK